MDDLEDLPLRDASSSVKTILIVEDDPGIGAFLREAIILETSHAVLLVTTSEQAFSLVQQVKPNLLILDYYLQHSTGIALYDSLHALAGLEAVPAIVLSASLQKHQQEIECRHLLGLAKPIELDELLNTISSLLQRA